MTKVEKAEHLLPMQNRLGEGPLWHSEEGLLYWVSIEEGLFFRYDPASGRQERFDVGEPVSVLGFCDGGPHHFSAARSRQRGRALQRRRGRPGGSFLGGHHDPLRRDEQPLQARPRRIGAHDGEGAGHLQRHWLEP